MQHEVVLAFRDEDGAWREVEVASGRFTIGSGADNNLRIDAPAVSRRHAVIETHEGGVHAYDCQSQHGTLLNNAPLRGSAALRSGDLLTLGGACDITVKLRATPAPDPRRPAATPRDPATAEARAQSVRQSTRQPTRRPRRAEAPAPRRGGPSLTGTHAVAAAAVVLVILASGFLLLARRPPAADEGGKGEDLSSASSTDERSRRAPVKGKDDGVSGGSRASVGEEELERAAVRVVQRISGDDRPYAFPPEALRGISRQVDEYRQSNGLRAALASMQRDARAVAAAARGEGVVPEMVIYAALAGSVGDRDPPATARAMIPQLRELRATFGGDNADGSLLVVAAYTYGVGSKKSHPLLATIRRLVRDSFAERNVWYLRERGGLSDAAYDLVIRTIAAGVVIQDPRRYGVQAGPLIY